VRVIAPADLGGRSADARGWRCRFRLRLSRAASTVRTSPCRTSSRQAPITRGTSELESLADIVVRDAFAAAARLLVPDDLRGDLIAAITLIMVCGGPKT